MKTRNGFVSNSSSSSFIVGVKSDDELTSERLLELFKVQDDSPLYRFSKQLADWIMHNCEHQTRESILDDYGYDTIAAALDDDLILASLVDAGYNIYAASVSYNEAEDAIEAFLGNGGLDDIETESLVIKTLN